MPKRCDRVRCCLSLVAQLRIEVGAFSQQPVRSAIQALTFGGEIDLPGATLKQSNTELCFEVPDLVTNGALGEG